MNRASSSIAAVAAAVGLAVIAGCGGGGSAPVDDTPEGQAFLFRNAVMTIVASKMKTLSDMARNEIPADDAVFTKAANDLAALAGMATEGFMPQGIPDGSRAAPEIWDDWSDFERRAQSFQDAAEAVADAANNGGVEAARELVRPLAQTCGGCHNTYRAPEE